MGPTTRMLIMVMLGVLLATPAVQAMDFVTVGNPGNADDTHDDGYGRVNYQYRIGKYEVTAGQYTRFLNAEASDEDPRGLYHEFMMRPEGCKIQRTETADGYSYSVASDRADRPVTHVSWYDTAMFANWMTSGSSHQGAYDTRWSAGWGDSGNYTGIDRNQALNDYGTVYAIPTYDEWYKAAYHKNDGATANYFDYPTSSDTAPGYVNDSGNLSGTDDAFTDGAADPGNYATYDGDDGTRGVGSPYWRTEVGEWENSDSPYGTFDQGGNVQEWTETPINPRTPSSRFTLGGAWGYGAFTLSAECNLYQDDTSGGKYEGFRLVQILDPAANALLTAGNGTVDHQPTGFDDQGFTTAGMPEAAEALDQTVELDDLTFVPDDHGHDMVTLVVMYDEAEVLAKDIDEDTLRLYWYDEDDDAWVLAGKNSNTDQTTGAFVAGDPTNLLGDWGVDVTDDNVWANIDHASTYAVGGVPEPATLALVALGGVGLLARRRKA